MRNKEFRELQVSSSQLVFIFVVILILGVIIFLLGISVGKKQVQLAEKGSPLPQIETLKPEEVKASAPETGGGHIKESPSLPPEAKTESKQETKPAVQTQDVAKNLFYIQVGAFNNKEAALSLAESFKKDGYPSLVLDPSSTDRKPVFRVRVGGYKTREEAEGVREKLKSASKTKSDYFIVRD